MAISVTDGHGRSDALDTSRRSPYREPRRCAMRADDVRSTEFVRHGAYVCLRVPAGARPAVAAAGVPALADRLGLRNEFEPGDEERPDTIAFLRRVSATPADIAD